MVLITIGIGGKVSGVRVIWEWRGQTYSIRPTFPRSLYRLLRWWILGSGAVMWVEFFAKPPASGLQAVIMMLSVAVAIYPWAIRLGEKTTSIVTSPTGVRRMK